MGLQVFEDGGLFTLDGLPEDGAARQREARTRRQIQLIAGENCRQVVAIQAHEPGHLYVEDLAQALAHVSRNRFGLRQTSQLDREIGEGRRCLNAIGVAQAGVEHGSLEPPGATHLHRRHLFALRQQVEGSGRHRQVASRLVDPDPRVGGVEVRRIVARIRARICHFLPLAAHLRRRYMAAVMTSPSSGRMRRPARWS